MKRLTDNEVDFNLTTLKGWSLDENESRIIKYFEFKNFKEAIATMVKIGEVAEELGHHPDWYNSYNKLNIKCQRKCYHHLRLSNQLTRTRTIRETCHHSTNIYA